MRRLIRNKMTGEYFTRNGAWTKDVLLARDFPNIRSVVDVEQKYDLGRFEVVLLFAAQPGKYDVVIPWPAFT
jgi:hypothetical protein